MVVFLINKFESKDRNKAHDQFLELYDGLIVSIVKKFLGRSIEFDDLLQAGKLGLIHAASKFDPGKAKFSTYATNWVRQYCLRTIENNARNVRLPNHIHQALQQVLKYGIDLPIEELEVLTGLDRKKIIVAIDGYHTLTMCLDDIREFTYEDSIQMLSYEAMLEKCFLKLGIESKLKNAFYRHYDDQESIEKIANDIGIHQHVLQSKFDLIIKNFTMFMEEPTNEEDTN
jgi:RNA polymerase sigma factor (sigma-70 family)